MEEEADETLFWLEFVVNTEIVSQEQVAELISEGEQILAMVVTSIKTARSRKP